MTDREYIVVEMPVNSDDRGPEMDPAKVVKTLWEIWDEFNLTVSVHDSYEEAATAIRVLIDD